MQFPFDPAFRHEVTSRLAAFSRLADPKPALKPAAVALTLVETDAAPGAAAFLLTQRAKGLRAHSGQYALPGGRCDAGETAVAAALRELDEEIGLRLTEADVLGLLDDYPTRSGYLITPVVAWAGDAARLQPNPDEVAAVHRIPLTVITPPAAFDFVAIPQSERPLVRIRLNGHLVHAPTAALIYQFREVLAGRATRVAGLEQPPFAWR
jgi:8-oxo-dGTP pyrophosphatase MutT (NUDIX family)